MADFFEQPILHSPCEQPCEHWDLDENRQPTNKRIPNRRPAAFIAAAPKPRKQRRHQAQMVFDRAAEEVSSERQRHDVDALINALRRQLDAWRQLPERQWRVTPQTARVWISGLEAVNAKLGLSRVIDLSARVERGRPRPHSFHGCSPYAGCGRDAGAPKVAA